MKTYLTNLHVQEQAIRVAATVAPGAVLYGVPRGGIPAAYAVAHHVPRSFVVDDPAMASVIVDDIWDSGATAKRFQARYPQAQFKVLFDKRHPLWADQWLVLPWEVSLAGDDASAEDIVTRLLEYIGEDPTREGLRETPARVLKAWREWAQGYRQDPAEVLKVFTDGAELCGDEMVIVRNVPVVSKCEHHLADIVGTAHVGYIPNGKIVGLSKLARIVDVYARRLQVQERLTNQVANAIEEHLAPKGVGVVVTATHGCMITRGVKVQDSPTTTSAMRGVLRENHAARAEFLALCEAGR